MAMKMMVVNQVHNFNTNIPLAEKVRPYLDLEPVGVIGEGGFGSVLLTHCQIFDAYAVKVIPLKLPDWHEQDFDELEHAAQLRNELSVLSLTARERLPFCLSLVAYAFTEKHLRIVTDFAARGSVFHLVTASPDERLTPELAKFYCAEMALGVGHLHRHGVIHRDLGAHNVVIDYHGHLMVSDFGLSIREETANKRVGNIEYSAPEMLNDETYDCTVDWWSVGLTLYFMLTGKNPVWSSRLSDEDNVERILSKYPVNWKRVPTKGDAHLLDFLKSIIVHNPSRRLGRNGLEQVLRHPYLSELSVHKLINKEIPPPFPSVLKERDLLPDLDPIGQAMEDDLKAAPLVFEKPQFVDFD